MILSSEFIKHPWLESIGDSLACVAAKAAELSVIAMTGGKKSRMSELADVLIHAPGRITRE